MTERKAEKQTYRTARAGKPFAYALKPPHRFDALARKLMSDTLAMIDTLLDVFIAPGRNQWTFGGLKKQLLTAENLTRDMLREIAAALHVFPKAVRIPANSARAMSRQGSAAEKAPCFELLPAPSRKAATQNEEQYSPGKQSGRPARPDQRCPAPTERLVFARRLAALRDVLVHPGKHAARMARALYRAAEGRRHERLDLKSDEDLRHLHAQDMIAAHLRGDGLMFFLHDDALRRLDSS